MVHRSAYHLGINLLACVALVAWGNAAGLGKRQTLAWLAAWPLTHLLLATAPALERDGGLSGLLHTGVAIGAWTLVRHRVGQKQWVGCWVLAGVACAAAMDAIASMCAHGATTLLRAA